MEDKRAKILKVATRLFTENGFHATPTSLIAKESGVAVGTLFHYFKNKEELINSIYFEIKSEMRDMLAQSIPENKPFKIAAGILWENFVLWGIGSRDKFGFITQFYNSPFISNVTREEAEHGFEFIIPLVEKAKMECTIKNIETELFEELWFSSIICIVNYLIKNPDAAVESVISISFSLFWEGVSF